MRQRPNLITNISYQFYLLQSLANISSGERLVDPRHPENGSDALDRSKHLQNPHVINSSNPYPLHGSSKHTYHQLTGGHTQPPQAPGLTPYHYIHNPQLELDLQSAAGFDYGAAFGNPFESQSAMHYLPDSQFVGYRPADAYALGFESQLHNSFGPNGNSKTAATPQYSYGSHASRYGNQSYPPSQQYPDTQLLQPTFAHPSENMNPSRTVADSKVGSRNPQVLLLFYFLFFVFRLLPDLNETTKLKAIFELRDYTTRIEVADSDVFTDGRSFKIFFIDACNKMRNSCAFYALQYFNQGSKIYGVVGPFSD